MPSGYVHIHIVFINACYACFFYICWIAEFGRINIFADSSRNLVSLHPFPAVTRAQWISRQRALLGATTTRLSFVCWLSYQKPNGNPSRFLFSREHQLFEFANLLLPIVALWHLAICVFLIHHVRTPIAVSCRYTWPIWMWTPLLRTLLRGSEDEVSTRDG